MRSVSLSRKPLAFTRKASNTYSSRSKVVSTSALVSRMQRAALPPTASRAALDGLAGRFSAR